MKVRSLLAMVLSTCLLCLLAPQRSMGQYTVSIDSTKYVNAGCDDAILVTKPQNTDKDKEFSIQTGGLYLFASTLGWHMDYSGFYAFRFYPDGQVLEFSAVPGHRMKEKEINRYLQEYLTLEKYKSISAPFIESIIQEAPFEKCRIDIKVGTLMSEKNKFWIKHGPGQKILDGLIVPKGSKENHPRDGLMFFEFEAVNKPSLPCFHFYADKEDLSKCSYNPCGHLPPWPDDPVLRQ